MKIENLEIYNFRGIAHARFQDLSNLVVVAGQNGSGKSCIFDAIRLLKSVYGGYAGNEYQQWFGEFQINLGDPAALRKLFRDPDRPIRIEASISFAESEQVFLHGNADSLVQ